MRLIFVLLADILNAQLAMRKGSGAVKKFKTALQTMVVHKDIDELGAFETLKKVKAIGYNAAEISGHFACDQRLVDGFVRARKELGMETAALSVHYTGGADDDMPAFFRHEPLRLEEEFARVADYCGQLECKYVRYAGMPIEQLDSWEKLTAYLEHTQALAKKCREQGIVMCAHNHDAEFAKINGKSYFEWEVEKCPDLAFEFCVLGAVHAGLDLQDVLERIRGRVPLIHFEDVKITAKPMMVGGKRTSLSEIIRGCPLGDGNVNVKKFCDKAIECGNEYFILEVTDFYGEDVYAAMKRAADSLKAAGYEDTF